MILRVFDSRSPNEQLDPFFDNDEYTIVGLDKQAEVWYTTYMEPNASLSMSYFTSHAVYGVKRNDKYLYIGKTKGILLRFAGHHIINRRLQLQPGDVLDIWWCATPYDAFSLEDELIRRWDPPYNGGVVNKMKARIKVYNDNPENPPYS